MLPPPAADCPDAIGPVGAHAGQNETERQAEP
jgi:hypothetical protein